MIKVKHGRKAKTGSQKIGVAADQEVDFIAEKVRQARRLADRYIEGEAKLDGDMFSIMECAMELHDKFVFLGEMEAPLKATLKRENIRITKNTTSSFIPLMKLVAPHLPSSTRGRSASILFYANANEVGAPALRKFVLETGGIVKCAKAANAAKAPERKQRRAEKDDAKLEALRDNAKIFSAPVLRDGLADGISCCLIEKKGGKLRLLSVMPGHLGNGFQPIADDEFIDFG